MTPALVVIFNDQSGQRNPAVIVVIKGPVILVSDFTFAAANNNAAVRPDHKLEAQEIYDDVMRRKGKVDPETARRFVNKVYYRAYDHLSGLSDLSLGLKLNLYESIAAENNPYNAEFLDALNQEMGLTEAFYRQEAKFMEKFFSGEHAAVLDRQWSEAGHAGTFSEAMHSAIMNPEATGAEKKKELIRFIAESFCAFTGQSCPEIDFFKGDPRSRGYAAPDGSVVGINEDAPSFRQDFLELLFTTMHELDHRVQRDLGEACRDGRLDRDHPLYTAGRVYQANLVNGFGYIPPENPVGHEAYTQQPAEVGANYAAGMAAYRANKLYGAGWRKPAARFDGPRLAA